MSHSGDNLDITEAEYLALKGRAEKWGRHSCLDSTFNGKTAREWLAYAESLEAALRKYGRHTDECSLYQAWNERNRVCDCGLTAALTGPGEPDLHGDVHGGVPLSMQRTAGPGEPERRCFNDNPLSDGHGHSAGACIDRTPGHTAQPTPSPLETRADWYKAPAAPTPSEQDTDG